MEFREFSKQMQQDIYAALAETSPGAEVAQRHVDKLQGESYDALSVTPPDGHMGVNINLDRMYTQVRDGVSYESVLQTAIRQVSDGLKAMPQVDLQDITSYENAKKLLCVEVVGTKVNEEMLKSVPHIDMEDMSMVYRLQLANTPDGVGTVLVTDDLLNRFGVSQEQLHADAMENSPKIRPAVMKTMAETMAEMTGMSPEEMGEPMGPQMYVVSNADKVQGAAAAFYPDFMEQAAKEIGGNFFVLPSSVHEVLFLQDDGTARADDLKMIVSTINADVVDPSERLTDNVYHFDAQARVFELGEKYESRQAAKEAERDGKTSVLKDLQEKKQGIDARPKAVPHKAKEEQVL